MTIRPRFAASVILARAAPRGFELYMTRRSRHSPFAAGAFVFPGGTVDARDFSQEARAQTLGLEPARVRALFKAQDPHELPSGEAGIDDAAAAALLVAALRELFEEAGILIARTAGGSPVAALAVAADDVREARARIGTGELAFADFLARHDWFADARELSLFSHWITPPTEPRRYNTHFFFALAPPQQAGMADAHETHEGIWIAPHAALARHGDPAFHLVHPTLKHLQRLAAFDSIEDLRLFAVSKDVFTILPRTTADGGFSLPAALEDAW
ncbi:MAG: hypothetical protein JOY69_07090 [Candidatus Eremiobacteraeota bacterium]|nr:hypothetical protein [Candidatus Eremiobacteraeota bacterium]